MFYPKIVLQCYHLKISLWLIECAGSVIVIFAYWTVNDLLIFLFAYWIVIDLPFLHRKNIYFTTNTLENCFYWFSPIDYNFFFKSLRSDSKEWFVHESDITDILDHLNLTSMTVFTFALIVIKTLMGHINALFCHFLVKGHNTLFEGVCIRLTWHLHNHDMTHVINMKEVLCLFMTNVIRCNSLSCHF